MWKINNNEEKQVHIKEQFSDKYTLYQHSVITMGSLVINTKNECRWDVRVSDISEKYYRIELLTLDNVITETNNDNIRDISLLNNTFKKMYSELNFLVNHQGTLIKVLNLDVIKKKWQQVKSEMEIIQAKHQSINGLITLNDEIFASDHNIVEAVRSNEFFEIFFNCFFGTTIAGSTTIKKKSLFMQADVEWKYDIFAIPQLPATTKTVNIVIKGTPAQSLNKDWLTQAYGSFPITTATELKPVLSETAEYTIQNHTGKVLKAAIVKEEIAHPQLLFGKIKYELIADGFDPANPEPVKPRAADSESNTNNRKTSFMFD
jgi:hypothetical protein